MLLVQVNKVIYSVGELDTSNGVTYVSGYADLFGKITKGVINVFTIETHGDGEIAAVRIASRCVEKHYGSFARVDDYIFGIIETSKTKDETEVCEPMLEFVEGDIRLFQYICLGGTFLHLNDKNYKGGVERHLSRTKATCLCATKTTTAY